GCSACTAVGLQDVAIDRDRAFAERLHIGNGAQASSDQPLYLVRASGWSTTTDLTRRARLRRAREHRVLGRQPSLARVSQKRWHAIFYRRGANNARVAHF